MLKKVIKYIFSSQNKNISKKYILSQFPYPSGDLHLGHARVYYIGDAIAKYYKLKNNQVIYPIGWDSFGLPAQNAAILHGKNPKQWTLNNIKRMKDQLNHLGINFNWEMELSTSQPQYYRWTQQIFVRMFKKGLAYKQMAQVNWDPVDKTVLANQQVDQNGFSWRSGAKVQKKMLNQWFLKITNYGEILQKNLDNLEWIQKVKNMQKGWINFKNGFRYKLSLQTIQKQIKQIDVYFQQIKQWQNASFLLRNKKPLQSNNNQNQIIGKVINPLTGQYLLVLQSQHQFSQKFILINAKNQKVSSTYRQIYKKIQIEINNNINAQGSIAKIFKIEEFSKQIEKISYMRMKDWLISRQRFWGCPIPIVYCNNCGIVPVPQNQLPVLLPQWNNQGNPLTKDQFKKCKCPKCGNSQAQRQSDTMDTFVDSSWYFLRFMDNKNKRQIFAKENVNRMMPVDVYIGGIQHAIMHLLYARLIMRFIKQEYNLAQNCSQPFKQLLVQGLVKGRTLSLKQNGKYISQKDINQGKYNIQDVKITYQKMSKSKFNGLNPNVLVDQYGSDALRISLFFANPPQKDIDFSQQIVINADRFLKRIQNLWKQISIICIQNKEHLNRNKNQLLQKNDLLELKNIFQKMQISIQKKLMHTYVANVMQMFNFIKQLIENKQKNIKNYQKIKLFITFIRILQIIAPQLSQKIKAQCLKNDKYKQIIGQEQFNIWPNDQLFGQKIEVMIMKGKKLIKKDTVNISMNQEDMIKYLNIQQNNVIQIKKQKKKYVIILKS